jgi:phosphoribosylformylglycinamidine (FGAM) synthase PurS component
MGGRQTVAYFLILVELLRSFHYLFAAAAVSANKVMVTLLLELKSAVSDLTCQMSTVTELLQGLQSSSSSQATAAAETIGFNLPVENKEALDELEDQLLQNKTLANTLVNYYLLCYVFIHSITLT